MTLKDLIKKTSTKFLIVFYLLATLITISIFFLYIKTDHSLVCQSMRFYFKGIEEQLAREIALGENEVANAIFNRFIKDKNNFQMGGDFHLNFLSKPWKGNIFNEDYAVCSLNLFHTKWISHLSFNNYSVAKIVGKISLVSKNIVCSFVFFYLLVLISFYSLWRRIFYETMRVNFFNPLNDLSLGYLPSSGLNLPEEISKISKNMYLLKDSIFESKREENEVDRIREIQKKGLKLAHDIRTPLSILNMLVQDFKKISEKDRMIFLKSLKNINEIVNSFVRFNGIRSSRLEVDDSINENDDMESFIPFIVDMIINEKKEQYKNFVLLEFQFILKEECHLLYSHVVRNDFKNIVNNILENAIQASSYKGRIEVSIFCKEGFIFISVKDYGHGIDENLLILLGSNRITTKKEGNGVALINAKRDLALWGGSLNIISEKELGTEVIIKIPQINIPDWTLSVIDFTAFKKIIIADDNEDVHHIWNKRFLKLDKFLSNYDIGHFNNIEDLKIYLDLDIEHESIYLLDFDFSLGETKNKYDGLKLIMDYRLQSRAILVTGHFDDEKLIYLCRKNSIKILPKMLLTMIPIRY